MTRLRCTNKTPCGLQLRLLYGWDFGPEYKSCHLKENSYKPDVS